MHTIHKVHSIVTVIALAAIAAGCGGASGTQKAAVSAAGSTAAPKVSRGAFTDSRDAQKYRTVKILGLTWMAENLNFVTDKSACYDNADSSCTKYGRLYKWDDAMSACPAGWRVPGDEEWSSLTLAAGGRLAGDSEWRFAGRKLKSTSGWEKRKDNKDNRVPGDGTDNFGFTALPGGFRSVKGEFQAAGYRGIWWSASQTETGRAWEWGMSHWADHESVSRESADKAVMRSLRCVSGTASVPKIAAPVVPAVRTAGSGSFTDPRDGKKYRTVKIGEQRWMAEGLRYKTAASTCNDEEGNCQALGRNYTWEEAKTACPPGWHLPYNDEWEKLIKFVDPGYESEKKSVAAVKLKARSGWEEYLGQSGNGTDDFGFTAMPDGSAGRNPGSQRGWWSASYSGLGRGGSHLGGCATMRYEDAYVSVGHCREHLFAFGVRCVEDTGAAGSVAAAPAVRAADVQATPAAPVSGGASFTDPRNGQTYRTVKIGSLTWMAENLNYETNLSSAHPYDKCGRFYGWIEANKACPDGWRLPRSAEWDSMAAAAGGRRGKVDVGDYAGNGRYHWIGAGAKLKSKEGWNNNLNGSDEFGFSALPCESRNDNSYGYRTAWWTATELNSVSAGAWEINGEIDGDEGDLKKRSPAKGSLLSLRCVQR